MTEQGKSAQQNPDAALTGPDQARRFRMKADELRAVAAQMKNADTKASCERMAETYERLADHLDPKVSRASRRAPEAG